MSSTTTSTKSTPPSSVCSTSEVTLTGRIRGLPNPKRHELLTSAHGSIAVRGPDGRIQILKPDVPLRLVVHFAPKLRGYWVRTTTHGDLVLFDHDLRNLPVARLRADAVHRVVDGMVDHVRDGTPHAVPFAGDVEGMIGVFYALRVFGMAGTADQFRAQIGRMLRRKYGRMRRDEGGFRGYLESLDGMCDPNDALLDEGYECLYQKKR